MKKSYIKPESRSRVVKHVTMICGSNLGYSDAQGTNGNVSSGSNDIKEHDLWGNEW